MCLSNHVLITKNYRVIQSMFELLKELAIAESLHSKISDKTVFSFIYLL